MADDPKRQRPADPDEARLVALLSASGRGDHQAFGRLYQAAAPRLNTVARYMLRDAGLAEDVLQESFVQIWRDADRFDPARGSAMAWMTMIVRHRALDQLRKRRGVAEDIEPVLAVLADDTPGPVERLLAWADRRAVRKCLQLLSHAQRDAVVMAFFRGLTHGELAEQLAQPLGTVKAWVRRGLIRLKQCVDHESA